VSTLLGTGERALIVVGKLREIEEAQFRLDLRAVADGVTDSEVVAEGQTRTTIGELRNDLDEARQRLLDRYGDLLIEAGYPVADTPV
jgi:hypothetical protein